MTKKVSNPGPPDGVVRPPAPPAPPSGALYNSVMASSEHDLLKLMRTVGYGRTIDLAIVAWATSLYEQGVCPTIEAVLEDRKSWVSYLE